MIALALGIAIITPIVVVLRVEDRAPRLHLVDRPNARSSHVVPRPRGGGLGVIIGTGAGLSLLVAAGWPLGTPALGVLTGAALVAVAGLWDDVARLSVSVRLVVQSAGAALVVAGCGGFTHLPAPPPFDVPLPPAVGLVLAFVWIVGVSNFFNFMDGADGLAAGQAGLTSGALAFVLWPSTAGALALLTAASSIAFLTRNWSPARIFLGDVGSGWLGFLLAALPFLADAATRSAVVLLVSTSLALFLVDPLLTLTSRSMRGASLTESHREHAYQRLFVPGEPHARVVSALLLAGASTTATAAWAFEQPDWLWVSVVWALVVCAAEWAIAARTAGKGART